MSKKDYGAFYGPLAESLSAWSPWLNWANRILTGFVYGAYPLLVVYELVRSGWQACLTLLIWPALGFALVTFMRKGLNQPRPYERWPIKPLLTKDTVGQSFPSRHVFSATVIGMVALSSQIWLGGVILTIALLLAILRVLGGVHYPKDVLVGLALGVAMGLPVFFW